MKRLLVIPALMFAGAASAEYREGWTYQNFYEAIHLCRSAIVYPTARDYEKAGLKKGRESAPLKQELIANTPLFESTASAVCYCSLNDYAKDKTFADYEKDREKKGVAEYIQTPRRRTKAEEAMNEIKANPKGKTLP